MTRLQCTGQEDIWHLHAALAECHELDGLDDFKTFIQTRIRQVLPHRMAVCGLVEFRSRRVLRLINIDFPTGYLQRVIRPDQVTLAFPLKDWICKRCPMVILTDQADSRASSPWNSAAREYGIHSIAYYGITDVSGTVSSYFAFGELDQWTAESYTRLLNLIVPHLHAALVKILTMEHLIQAIGIEARDIEAASQQSDSSARDLARFNITEREQQVLRWMAAGKSNWEIGTILHISEFTAKNHVQSVLRKLSVSSRAQAVAKAISHRLVAGDAAPDQDDPADLFSTGRRDASGPERARKTL